MGFPSPAADFVAPRLSPEIICGIGMGSRILETLVWLCGYRAVHQTGTESGSANPQRRTDSVCQSHGQGADL